MRTSPALGFVTNNLTVNLKVFTTHIVPRTDLLFGSSNRQWLTRLYYLAHSPFLLTWAVDSNVYVCYPDLAATFLRDAYFAELWKYDIVTANQHRTNYYPHNFCMLNLWNP